MFSLSSIAFTTCVGLATGLPAPPEIALIIDDIGNNYANGRAAVELPHAFAYAILPFSPHAKSLAYLANSLDKDVIVHLPMEAQNDNHLLGPGALLVNMSQNEIESTFLESIEAIPYAIGINNHMGSRLTREPVHMRWLMHAIHERGGLFFIDSRTTKESVALQSAQRSGIAATFRDVFLDNVHNRHYIEEQLDNLIDKAKRDGHALGIAHPHPLTIDIFQNWDPSAAGVRVVKISEYIAAHQHTADTTSMRLQPRAVAAAECGNDRDNTDATENPYTQR